MLRRCSRILPSLARSYAYKPQPHALKGTKTQPIPSDPSQYHNFINTYTSIHDPRITDTIAMQVFTHKSFQHGKSPYNEKLAFLGRRVLAYHVSTYSLTHPIDLEVLDYRNVAKVIESIPGFTALLRWKPKNEEAVLESGRKKVAAESFLALVGAIELRCGGHVAAKFVNGTVIPALIKATSLD